MAISTTLLETKGLAGSLEPAADAAGRTGHYVDLKRTHRTYVVFFIAQGNAATVLCSLSKVTTIAAAVGATVTTANHRIWANQDTTLSSTFVAQTAAANFTTSATLKNKIVIFEVEPGSEGSTFIGIAPVTGASNVANITSAITITEPKISAATVADAMVD